MKTEDLVALLSANTEPVDLKLIQRTAFIVLCAALVLSIGAILILLGLRADFMTTRPLIFLCVKVAFAIGIVVVATLFLTKLARPGGEQTLSSGLVMLPFIAVVLIAAINLGFAPKSQWGKMIMGDDWLECLLSIPIIAIVPFAMAIWAMRLAAPTNLVRAGACAGLVAGGVSALAYALHCSDDFMPFIAIWYSGTILLCAFAGAVFGPRLLRW